MRMRTIAVVAPLLAFAVAGCGGNGGGERLSRDAYVAKAKCDLPRRRDQATRPARADPDRPDPPLRRSGSTDPGRRNPDKATSGRARRPDRRAIVVRLEDELVAAGQVGAALDLGDDAGGDLLDHAAGELAADDAQVAERLADREPALVVEQRQPRRRAAAARRAVDLAVGEDGDVALRERRPRPPPARRSRRRRRAARARAGGRPRGRASRSALIARPSSISRGSSGGSTRSSSEA